MNRRLWIFGVACVLAATLSACASAAVVEAGTGLALMMGPVIVVIALYLAYLGTAGPRGGVLLWPGVALHAVVALGLWTWRSRA